MNENSKDSSQLLQKIPHDIHVHTRLSACFGDKSIKAIDMLHRCKELGITTVGFADHVWCNPDVEPSGWYASQGFEQVEKLRDELDQCEIPSGMRVLTGCESETIAPGVFGITPEFTQKCDFVLLPANHTHIKDFVRQAKSDRPRDIADNILEMFRSAAASGLATGIVHPIIPLGMLDQTPAVIESISDAEFEDAFAIAAENDVSIEITTGYLAKDDSPWMPELCLRFLTAAKSVGCKFHFGSDAHDLERLGKLTQLTYFIENLNLCKSDILDI